MEVVSLLISGIVIVSLCDITVGLHPFAYAGALFAWIVVALRPRWFSLNLTYTRWVLLVVLCLPIVLGLSYLSTKLNTPREVVYSVFGAVTMLMMKLVNMRPEVSPTSKDTL